MRPVLLGLAAAVVISAAPVAAQNLGGAGITAGSAFGSTGSGGTTEGIRNATSSLTGVSVHRGGAGQGDGQRDGQRDGRGHQRRGDGFGGYLALRDGYDLNQGWASNSYNDWWHDRPDRAFPRWLGANQDCQRQYWTGGGWRC